MISLPYTVHLALRQPACTFVRRVHAQGHVQVRRLSRLAQSYQVPTLEEKVVILSGIQPTGIPHLGNYLGALEPWAKLQDAVHPESTLLFSLVDLHALSKMHVAEQRRQSRRETLAAMLASGLDPKRSIIFRQSAVKEHAELHWILSCISPVGLLQRQHAWKAYAKDPVTKVRDPGQIMLALLTYPVLQAADILLYRATHVPIGPDQKQHLEFARHLADKFGATFQPRAFPLPEAVVAAVKEIKSLSMPEHKMSKSSRAHQPRSLLLLNDTREEISAKVKVALTDSISGLEYDPKKRPGVSNLLNILFHCAYDGGEKADGPRTVQDLVEEYRDMNLSALKSRVAAAVDEKIAPIRTRMDELLKTKAGSKELESVVEQGAVRARVIAEKTMADVRDIIGL